MANSLASEPHKTALVPSFNFHTVTSVAWSASGRNVGIGTPDGFLLYSAEPLVSRAGVSSSASPPVDAVHEAKEEMTGAKEELPCLQEVARRVVYGGVGLLALYKQSSVIAITGVQSRSAASRVQLVDVTRAMAVPNPQMPSTALNEAVGGSTTANAQAETPPCLASAEDPPWFPDDATKVSEWLQRVQFASSSSATPVSTVATLAHTVFPSMVAALSFCPNFILVATSGDPRIAGSHSLYIFDQHLHQLYLLPIFPPRSNSFLSDTVAIASSFTPALGAGVKIEWLRALLPGSRRGEVRLLTFKKTSLIGHPGGGESHSHGQSDLSRKMSTHGEQHPSNTAAAATGTNSGEYFILVEKLVHQAPLRAVAITEDGKRGVTMSEKGTRIKLLEFIEDGKISERLCLERGKLPAVTDAACLAIATVPQAAAQNHHRNVSECKVALDMGYSQHTSGFDSAPASPVVESIQDIVVCLTSSGTLHIFGCGKHQLLFYRNDKTLLPPVGYPYAFSICIPQLLLERCAATLFVARYDLQCSSMRYLPMLEQHRRMAAAATTYVSLNTPTGTPSASTTQHTRSTPSHLNSDEIPGEVSVFLIDYSASLQNSFCSPGLSHLSSPPLDPPRCAQTQHFRLSAS